MGVMAMAISMMFYLGKEKVMPIEKELLAIINSYHGWDYYESEKYGRIGMIKIWTDVEIKKRDNKQRYYKNGASVVRQVF